jgi:hypothetical protein
MFTTHIAWTAPGMASRSALMTNLQVVSPESFVAALGDLIRGWSTMRYSQQDPDTSPFRNNGFGELRWQDGHNPRFCNIQMSFRPSRWTYGKEVTLTMLAVT